MITDSEGKVISRRDFLPFGEQLDPDVGGRSSVTAYQPATDNVKQKFTGYQKDDESGLDFAEARMYENRHGRFTAVDPLLASGKSANPQTFNRFVYCLNTPLACVDPTGLDGTWYYTSDPEKLKEKCPPPNTCSGYYENFESNPGDGWNEVNFGANYYLTVNTRAGTQFIYNDGTADFGDIAKDFERKKALLHSVNPADANFFLGMGLSTVENGIRLPVFPQSSPTLNLIPTTRNGQWYSPSYEKWYGNDFYGNASVPSQFKTLALSRAANAAMIDTYAGSNVTRSYQLLAASDAQRSLSMAKWLGRASFTGGAAITTVQLANGQISPLRATTDTVASYIGLVGGPKGMAISGAYFIGTKGFIDGPTYPQGGYRTISTTMCHNRCPNIIGSRAATPTFQEVATPLRRRKP